MKNLWKVTLKIMISIHALREEGDLPAGRYDSPHSGFLSTPSARRATLSTNLLSYQFMISIHALREEGDILPGLSKNRKGNFYPRPPRGGRP